MRLALVALALAACAPALDAPDAAAPNAVPITCEITAPAACTPGCGLLPGSHVVGAACVLVQSARFCEGAGDAVSTLADALFTVRAAARAWVAANCGYTAFCSAAVACRAEAPVAVAACDAGCPDQPLYDARGWHFGDATRVPPDQWSSCADALYTALDTPMVCRR